MGALLIAFAGPIASLTDLPPGFLSLAGIALIPVSAFMAGTAVRARAPRWAARLIVAGNVLWAAASLLVVFGGVVAPNALGLALIVGQAAVVAALAKLEFDASRAIPATL